MKSSLIILFLLFFIITGCMTTEGTLRFTTEEVTMTDIQNSENFKTTTTNTTIIDMNNVVGTGRIEENELFESIELVPLETKKASVFQGIIQIELCNDRFFIKDENNDVFIFNKDGHFITKLSRGQGPGEVYRVGAITWDENNQQLIVCQNDILNFYDKNGKFVKQQKCPLLFGEFFSTNERYLFYEDRNVNHHLGDGAKCAFFISDKNFKIMSKGIEAIPSQFDYVRTMKMVLPYNSNMYLVSQFFNDTIFEINSKSNVIAAKYILDYHKKKTTLQDYVEQKNNDKFYNISTVFENSKSQLFQFWSRKNGLCFVLRDKMTGNMMGGTELFVDETIVPECLFHTRNIYNDFFVSYTDAYKGMHYASPSVSTTSNQKVSKLDEEDNPVIILYKFKQIK